MTPQHPRTGPPAPQMRRLLVLSVLALLGVPVAAAVLFGTSAQTDPDTTPPPGPSATPRPGAGDPTTRPDVPGDNLTPEPVGLSVTGVGGRTAPAGSLSMSNMAPGDAVVGELEVTNTGTAGLDYTLVATFAGDLSPVLYADARYGVTDCTVTGFEATGTTSPQTNDTSTGNGRGTRRVTPARPLPPGRSETVCLRVRLDTAADNTYAGRGPTTADFTFTATERR